MLAVDRAVGKLYLGGKETKMTSKGLLSIIYDLSQITTQRAIKTKEILASVAMKEGAYDETEIKLLLYNLEQKGFIDLTKSSRFGVTGVSLTKLGKRTAEGERY